MSKKSFTAVFQRCDSDVGADGMAAIFNESVRKTVHITSIRLMTKAINPDITNPLGNQGIISLDRISAVSGGTEVAPDKFDTGASNLPSQVKLYEHPDSVTITDTLRRFGDCVSTYTIVKQIPFQAMMRSPGVCDANDHSGRTCEGHNIWHADGTADTEPIVLNEGQGICLTRREFGFPQAMHFGITVKVVSTGKTYKWRDGDIGTSYEKGQASLALINGSGSGVVLHVMIVSLPDLGEENQPNYRVVRISAGSAHIAFPGTDETVVAHDTANSLSEVTARRGPMLVYPSAVANGATINYTDYQGTPISIAVQQKFDVIRRFSGSGPFITETGTVNTIHHDMFLDGQYEIWPGVVEGGFATDTITIQPGQGIAVIGGGAGQIETSELAYLDIEISGYLQDDADPAEIAQAVWTATGRTLTA